MGLEAATYINQLNPSNPVGAVDPKSQGDDHIRLVKSTIQATFPSITGAMTRTHTELNAAHISSAVVKGPDGTVALPAYSFTSDPDTGIYRAGANDIRITRGGVDAILFDAAGVSPVMVVIGVDGAVGAPSFSFRNDTDSGMYRIGPNNLGISVNGVVGINLSTAGIIVTGSISSTLTNTTGFFIPDGNTGVATPGLAFSADTDTGFARPSANTINIVLGGSNSYSFSGTLFSASGLIQAADGLVGGPTYSFSSDTNIGLYRLGADYFGAAAGGAFAGGWVHAGVLPQAVMVDGTAAVPGMCFDANRNTGFYRIGADAIGFAEGGAGFRIGFRSVPRSTTATTLAIGDVGKCVAVSAAINIPVSVFSAGDCLSIYNDSAASINITTSAGTLRLAGTTTTGTRALAPRGMATLWFNVGGATPETICSGPGVS